MNKNNSTLEETFTLAYENYQKDFSKVAATLCQKILKIDSNHFGSNFLMGLISLRHKNYDNAIYFSREPVPSSQKAEALNHTKFKQLGIIAFRNQFLQQITKLSPTPLEQLESVDMLRVVEHGFKVRMVLSPFQMIGVDTPSDLERAVCLMKRDPYFGKY